MPLLERVEKVVADTGAVTHQDSEAMAKAAIATIFNWMHDPTGASFSNAARKSRVSPATAERVWQAMLSEIRKEANL